LVGDLGVKPKTKFHLYRIHLANTIFGQIKIIFG
jgi:hypothetical protein